KGRGTMTFDERRRLDIEYIERRSTMLDLRLIAETALAVCKGSGAYLPTVARAPALSAGLPSRVVRDATRPGDRDPRAARPPAHSQAPHVPASRRRSCGAGHPAARACAR